MAVTIINIDDISFSINGIKYIKNFVSVVSGDLVRIQNVYDGKLVLQVNANYADYTVDGGSFGSAALLQTALVEVLFNRDLQGFESRIENLEQNQLNGVFFFNTKILMEAADATGQLNFAYEVIAEVAPNTSLNGKYTSDGATYTQQTFNVNGIIELDNTDAVNGGVTWDSQKDINYQYYNFNDFTNNTGFINRTNGVFGAQSGFSHTEEYLPILPDTEYNFFMGNTQGNAGCAWYDEDQTYISGFTTLFLTLTANTSPSNAKFMRCSGAGADASTWYIISTEKSYNINKIKEISENHVLPQGSIQSGEKRSVSGGDINIEILKTYNSEIVVAGDLINFKTNAIEIPSTILVHVFDEVKTPTNLNTTISVTTSSYLYFTYNLTTNAFEVVPYASVSDEELNNTIFVLAVIDQYMNYFYPLFDCKLNGFIHKKAYPSKYRQAVFIENSYIDYRLTKFEIIIPDDMFITDGIISFVPANRGSTIVYPSPIDTYILYYEKSSNEIKITSSFSDYLDVFEINGNVLIATVRGGGLVDSYHPYYLNGVFMGNGVIDEEFDLPILPDTLYFIKDEPLSIYKSSMIGQSKIFNDIQFSLKDDDNLRVETFYDSLRINPTDYGDNLAFKINGFDRNVDQSFHYSKDVIKVVTDPINVVNTTPKALFIGDSLFASTDGNRSLRKQYVDVLTARGLTPTLVGTGLDSNGLRSDSAGGYTYTAHIGQTNTNGTDVILPTVAGLDTKTNGLSNSFLRLADATDKTNYPQWCFASTGAQLEESYADNPALGTYYIFDFDWYLSDHSVATPDIIHIALGTNDVIANWATITQRVDAFGWMILRIRQALPTVKISVLPYHQFGDSYETSNGLVEMAQAIIDEIHVLADSNILMSPVFAHLPKRYTFKESIISLPTRDYDKIDLGGDFIHPSEWGYKLYAKILEALTLSTL